MWSERDDTKGIMITPTPKAFAVTCSLHCFGKPLRAEASRRCGNFCNSLCALQAVTSWQQNFITSALSEGKSSHSGA
jgi:hypothetical protein